MKKLWVNDVVWALAFTAVTFALGQLWTGGQRVLGHDPFHYLAYAKEFTTRWPEYFGTSWPFGYSLLGALGGRMGWPVYWTLVAVSQAAYAVLYFLFLRFAAREGAGRPQVLAVLAALACSPVVTQMGVSVMSEPLFAALLFAAACSLAYWPASGAVALTALAANAAFATRYVGIFLFGLIGVKVLLHYLPASPHQRRWMVALSGAGVALMAGLCYANFAHYGRITGPHPVGSESLTSWPWHFAEMGWSIVGAFSTGRLMAVLGGINYPPVFAVGALVAAAALAVCAAGVAKWKTHPVAAHIGLVTIGYVLTIVTMRSNTYFDNLFNPRMSEPVIFGVAFVLLALWPRAKWMTVMAFASILLSVVLAWRGMPAAVVPDIGYARSYLENHLRPQDSVTVNADARRLAAYFPNKFAWALISPGKFYDWDPGVARFTVAIFEQSRGSEAGETDKKAWQVAIDEALTRGVVKKVAGDERTVVLERVGGAAAPQ
jgi:hypothetical protein